MRMQSSSPRKYNPYDRPKSHASIWRSFLLHKCFYAFKIIQNGSFCQKSKRELLLKKMSSFGKLYNSTLLNPYWPSKVNSPKSGDSYHLERRALLLYLVVDVDTKLAAGGAFWGFVDVTDLTLDTEDGLSGSSGVSGLAPGQWFWREGAPSTVLPAHQQETALPGMSLRPGEEPDPWWKERHAHGKNSWFRPRLPSSASPPQCPGQRFHFTELQGSHL